MKEEATDHRHACTQQDIWRNALKKEKKKGLWFCYFTYIQYAWLQSRREHGTDRGRLLKDERSDLRDIYSWFILLRGHLVPRPDRLGLLAGFIKQRGPHKPTLILRQKFQVLLPSFN